MKKIPRQEYTQEFSELAVKQLKAGQSNRAVARELGLSDQTLRNWVKAAGNQVFEKQPLGTGTSIFLWQTPNSRTPTPDADTKLSIVILQIERERSKDRVFWVVNVDCWPYCEHYFEMPSE